MIHTLRNRYNCPIGHSDHTRGTDVPPLAVAAGANNLVAASAIFGAGQEQYESRINSMRGN